MGALQSVLQDINDWCGTRVPGHHPPSPHGLKDLLISVAISELAAQVENEQIRVQIQRLSADLQQHAEGQIGKSAAGG
jgi:hypothetical protein